MRPALTSPAAQVPARVAAATHVNMNMTGGVAFRVGIISSLFRSAREMIGGPDFRATCHITVTCHRTKYDRALRRGRPTQEANRRPTAPRLRDGPNNSRSRSSLRQMALIFLRRVHHP